MKKEKWYGQPGIYGIFITIITIGLLFAWFIKVQQQGNYQWQCVEWKNETVEAKGYLDYYFDCKDEKCLPIRGEAFDISGDEFEFEEKARRLGYINETRYDEIMSRYYSCNMECEDWAETQPILYGNLKVCAKEGKNCKEKYLVECYAPFDIELFAGYDRAINYCMSPFKLTTYKICKEYRDLKW